MITQLLVWKQIDQDIVILRDFKKNVYMGHIACQLSQDDLNLTKICHRHTRVMIPPRIWSGSAPIDGIFATPSIECVNVLILPHYEGVGNHWWFIVNLSSASMIGTLFLNIVQCAAWKLHCTGSQMVSVYNKELTRVCNEHNMFHWMNKILRLCNFLMDKIFYSFWMAWMMRWSGLMWPSG